MSGDCPSLVLVVGYLISVIGAFAAIWYLILWLTSCRQCAGTLLVYFYILGFALIFLFAASRLMKMFLPARAGLLPFRH